MMKLSCIRSSVSGQFCRNYPDLLRLPFNRLWSTLTSQFFISFILLIAAGSFSLGGNPKTSKAASSCLCDDVRLYVTQTGAGNKDGTNWANAYDDLSFALADARDYTCVNEIWVAAGTYKPIYDASYNAPVDARQKTFHLFEGLKIYGGFAGGETELDDRDVKGNITILSGEIGTPGDADNCYHVVLSAANNGEGITIDGFLIMWGNANNTNTDIMPVVNTKTIDWTKGGGIYLDNGGDNTVTNCIVTINTAEQGGGILIVGGSSTVSSNSINGNSSVTLSGTAVGAGMLLLGGEHAVFNNIIFGNNSAIGGGGVAQWDGISAFSNNTFFKNKANVIGGGMLLNGESAVSITNNIFWENDLIGETEIPQADYYLGEDATAVLKYNILQLEESDYISDNSNSLGIGAVGNLFQQDPMFVDKSNPHGADNIQGTEDDGLRVLCGPALLGGITGIGIPVKDILGTTRKDRPTIGAYELEVDLSLAIDDLEVTRNQSGTVVYVDCDGKLIGEVTSGVTNGVAGNTTAKVWVESSQPAKYVARHFEIRPDNDAATATATVTLYFSNDDFKNFNGQNPAPAKLLPDVTDEASVDSRKANVIIEKRSGEGGADGLPTTYSDGSLNITPTSVVWNAGLERWEVTFPVTGFSGFFLKTTESALPVRWISFSGTLSGEGQPALTWKVDEQGVDHYEVLRSTDAIHFEPLSRVPAKGNGIRNYVYTDVNPVAGTTYYRIKETDADGTFSYSRIISLNDGMEVKFSTYPNPAKREVVIMLDKKYIGTRMTMINTAGVEVQHFIVDAETFTADLSRYASGIYLLRTNDGKTLKLAKE